MEAKRLPAGADLGEIFMAPKYWLVRMHTLSEASLRILCGLVETVNRRFVMAAQNRGTSIQQHYRKWKHLRPVHRRVENVVFVLLS
jgi:hypothetical protein